MNEELVLSCNVRVHATEYRDYFCRHPELTNFVQQNRLARIVRTAVNLLPGKPSDVLDLGCGTGYLYLRFLDMGLHVTGVDLSAEMLGVLKENIPECRKSHAKLVNMGAVEFLKGNKEMFSFISMSAFLHHLYDYEVLLKAACAALKEEGVLLILFEPMKQTGRSAFRLVPRKLLACADEKAYKLVMRLRKTEVDRDLYRYADYQRQFGGIDIGDTRRILEGEGLTIALEEHYCALRYGVTSFVATNVLKAHNSFDIIGRKVSGRLSQ
ncbi:MAG: class I SAM-dependent methyltransferase [Lentisphaerae bacterium]|nr:class I SAM-dependent methyltransferase [Lentisphaerota bacterium]